MDSFFYSLYEPTDQFDLLTAMAKAIGEDNSLADYTDFSFAEYYRVWVNEPGYPILDVSISHSTGEITLKQVCTFGYDDITLYSPLSRDVSVYIHLHSIIG